MPGEDHRAMHRLSLYLYQNAFRSTARAFCSDFCKTIETLAVTINLNTLKEQSECFQVNLIANLK